MNIYVTILYTQTISRKYFGLFGPKRHDLHMIGINLQSSVTSVTMYDCGYRSSADERKNSQDMFALLPAMDSELWMSREQLLQNIRQFFYYKGHHSTVTIVTDGDPNEAAIMKVLIRDSKTSLFECDYKTIKQRLDDAVAWLPENVYGITSNFNTYYPLSESRNRHTWAEKMEMFMSHDLFPAKEVSASLTPRGYWLRQAFDAIESIMRMEISLLALREPDDIMENAGE